MPPRRCLLQQAPSEVGRVHLPRNSVGVRVLAADQVMLISIVTRRPRGWHVPELPVDVLARGPQVALGREEERVREAGRHGQHLLVVQPAPWVADVVCHLHKLGVHLSRRVEHPSRAQLPPQVVANAPDLENGCLAVRLVGGAEEIRRLIGSAAEAGSLGHAALIRAVVAQTARGGVDNVAEGPSCTVGARAAAHRRKLAHRAKQAGGGALAPLVLPRRALRARTVHLEPIHAEGALVAKPSTLARG